MPTIVNSGNFSNGIVPDVIGARDSLSDLVDGRIERDGEIRKRGKKRIFVHPINEPVPFFPSHPTASIFAYEPTSMVAINSDVRGKSSVATTLAGTSPANTYWDLALYRPSSLPPTIPTDDGFVQVPASPYGGGWGMKSWQNVAISPKRQVSPNLSTSAQPWQIGMWGGGRNTTGAALGNGTLSSTSSIVTGMVAADVNLTVGDWIQITGSPEYFRVEEIISAASIRLDRIPVGAGGVSPLSRVGCVRPMQTLPATLTYAGTAYPTASSWSPRTAYVVCEHQSRLFFGNMANHPSGLGWSATPAETPVRVGLFGATYTTYPIDACFEGAFTIAGSSDSGEITGMWSLGEQMVILKSDAIYTLRGEVSTIGLPTGASIDMIVPDSGCNHFESNCNSRIGVVWANSEGLWVYNGSSVRNLVDGVMTSAWSRVVGINPVVSAINSRIVAQNRTTGDCIVYDIDGGIFTRQTGTPSTNLVVIKDAGYSNIPSPLMGSSEYEIGTVKIPKVDNAVPANSHFYELQWDDDFIAPTYTDGVPSFTSRNVDNEDLDNPLLKILSQPLDPGAPFTDNRLNQILVSANMIANNGSDNPRLDVTLVGGRGSFVDETEPIQTLEYGVVTLGVDTTERIGVPGNRSTPASRVMIEEIDDVTSDPALDVSIFGVGAQFQEDFTVGNDS